MASKAKNLSSAFNIVNRELNDFILLADVKLKTQMAQRLAELMREEAVKYIDRPRPETLNSIVPALRGQFGVKIQGKAIVWMTKVIEGYSETNAYIPVVGNVPFDQYGNEPRGQFRRLLSDPDVFQIKRKRNGLPRGIYRRVGRRKLQKLYKYVRSQRRPSVFPYEDLADKNAEKVFFEAFTAGLLDDGDEQLKQNILVEYDIDI